MKERKNIKVNVNMFDDTKMKIIDTKPERDLIHYIWFRMITLAGKVDRDGELYLSKNIPYTVDTLAIEFNRSASEIGTAVNVLIDLEMVGFTKDNVFVVINYSKHQNSRKSKEVDKSAAEKHYLSTDSEKDNSHTCEENEKIADQDKEVNCQSKLENLNEYINKKNMSKSRKSRRKKKENNDIECVDCASDFNEECITFHDGEIPRKEGDVLKSWNFTE